MIAILGATGNVGKKIAGLLIKKGESLRLIARSADPLKSMVSKNVEAMAGDAGSTEFLVTAFKSVDTVFTLLPPNPKAETFIPYADKIGESISSALEIAKVKYVVNLSSIGAELPEGTGPIVGLHKQEERLDRIKGLNVLHVRAAYFMENLLGNIDLIKSKGIAGSAIRGDLKFPMIATKDIAAFAAERLVKKDFKGSSFRYLLGERNLSLTEVTELIGERIVKPGLAYVQFPYEEAEKGLVAMGLSPDVSKRYVEMGRAFNDGKVRFEKRTAENTTPTSIEAFCDEVFVPLYMREKAA